MSKKKNKKKFKAQLHQALQEMQREQPAVVTEKLKNKKTDELVEKTPEEITAQKSEGPASPSLGGRPLKVDDKKETVKASDEYVYVKKDVTKIVMIMSICIVLLVAIWILSLKTNYISNFANALATFSHLSQGK